MDSQTVMITIFSFLFGAVIGSFLNVVIYRLPLMLDREWTASAKEYLSEKGCYFTSRGNLVTSQELSLSLPASSCTHCNRKIKILHNIPLLSYFVLGGKCAYCRGRISLVYPLIEFTSGLFFAYFVYTYGLTLEAFASTVLCSFLIILAVIDFQRHKLYDILTFPLLWIGLLVNLQGLFTDLNSAVIGAATGYLFLWFINYIFVLFRKKQAIGHGDFKLLAAIGAWLGWQVLPMIIFMASAFGLLYFLTSIKKLKKSKVAFGTALSAAVIIQMLLF